MISNYQAHKFCRDAISEIENYEKAVNDTTQTWDLHHRDEIRILPSGMVAYRSKQDLIDSGRYFNCPANELIFLTRSEHNNLHHKGKIRSANTRKRISESLKGENHPMYGKTYNAEYKQKMSESLKAYWARRKQGGNYDAQMG